MSLEDAIPGLRDALAWEASARARAFLDLPYTLCGVEVSPLTLYRLAVLETARNPFVCGGPVTPEAVAQFLLVCSPDFRAGGVESADVRTGFIARLRAGGALEDLDACAREIAEFADEMFLDAPTGGGGGGGGSSTPTTSHEAVYVELFAVECGWSADQTLHTPLPQLYQVLRRITLRHDPKAVFINRRSDKVRGDWQRSQKAEVLT